MTTTIHVRLVDEPVDVSRPIQAELLHGRVFRILPQSYDQEIETWEFEPGRDVECDWIPTSDGRLFAAIKSA